MRSNATRSATSHRREELRPCPCDDRSRRLRRPRLRPPAGRSTRSALAPLGITLPSWSRPGRAAGFGENGKPVLLPRGRPRRRRPRPPRRLPREGPRDRRRLPRRRPRGRRDRLSAPRACARSTSRTTTAPTSWDPDGNNVEAVCHARQPARWVLNVTVTVGTTGFGPLPRWEERGHEEKTKTKRRDKTEGTVDRIAGRVLEADRQGDGKTSTKAKGKGRPHPRRGTSAKGRAKRREALAMGVLRGLGSVVGGCSPACSGCLRGS